MSKDINKAIDSLENEFNIQEVRSEVAKGKKRSEETKAKMREAWIKRKKDMS